MRDLKMFVKIVTGVFQKKDAQIPLLLTKLHSEAATERSSLKIAVPKI